MNFDIFLAGYFHGWSNSNNFAMTYFHVGNYVFKFFVLKEIITNLQNL